MTNEDRLADLKREEEILENNYKWASNVDSTRSEDLTEMYGGGLSAALKQYNERRAEAPKFLQKLEKIRYEIKTLGGKTALETENERRAEQEIKDIEYRKLRDTEQYRLREAQEHQCQIWINQGLCGNCGRKIGFITRKCKVCDKWEIENLWKKIRRMLIMFLPISAFIMSLIVVSHVFIASTVLSLVSFLFLFFSERYTTRRIVFLIVGIIINLSLTTQIAYQGNYLSIIIVINIASYILAIIFPKEDISI
jgi:hypothetical protein